MKVLLGCVVGVLLLAALLLVERAPGHTLAPPPAATASAPPWPEAVKLAYLRTCGAGLDAGRCGCTWASLQRRYTYAQYRAWDAATMWRVAAVMVTDCPS